MKIRSKVVTGTIAVALAAMMSNGRPVVAASAPSVLAAAPPTYLISARGLSLDGTFDNTGGTCTFCTIGDLRMFLFGRLKRWQRLL